MFISKLVCDKCGTEGSTSDKFCRECGTQGRPLSSKLKKPVTSTLRCRSCGKIVSNYGHDCPGLFTVDKGIDIRWNTYK